LLRAPSFRPPTSAQMDRSPYLEQESSFRSVPLHTPHSSGWHAHADVGGSAGGIDRRYSTSPSRSREALYAKARACNAARGSGARGHALAMQQCGQCGCGH
jgi:hypothetical protein